MQNRIKQLFLFWIFGIAMATALAEDADRNQPISIDADHVVVNELRRTSVFTGNVILTQGSMVIRAQKVVYQQDAASGEYSVEGSGSPLSFREKRDGEWVEAFAEKLEFDSRSGVIKLSRKALLKRGKDEVRGAVVTYNLKSQQYEVAGSLPDAAADKGRVHIVIGQPIKPVAPKPDKQGAP